MARRWSLVLGVVLVLVSGAVPAATQSPSPGASAGPIASPVPTDPATRPVGMPWVTTARVLTTGRKPVPRDVTAWSGGFAMLDGQGEATVRVSADGSRWSRRVRPGRLGAGARVAPHGDGLIVVGVDLGGRDLVAYRSDDGRQWRRMAGPPIFPGDPVRAVAGFASQVVTVGEWTLVRGGVECPEAICPEWGPRLWGVSLGGAWEALRADTDGGRITGIFPGRGRFLATVDRAEGAGDALVASPDGRTWRRIGGIDDGWANAGVLVGETRRGFVAVLPFSDVGDREVTVFASTDGSTWTDAELPLTTTGGLEWIDLSVDGDTAMVVGGVGELGPVAIISVDGGATWSVSSGWPSTAAGCFHGGAIRGAAAVAIGPCGPNGRAWVATVPWVPERGVGQAITGPVDPASIPWRYRCEGSDVAIQPLDLVDAPDVAVADPRAKRIIDRLAESGALPPNGWRLLARRDPEVLLVLAVPDRRIGSFWGQVLFRSGDADVWRGGVRCATSVRSAVGRWDRRIRLDRAFPPPTSRSRVLHLVTRGCAPVAGRPRVLMRAEAVIVQVPVASTSSCGDVGGRFDPARIRVTLPEPLGERTIWNGARLPFVPIRP